MKYFIIYWTFAWWTYKPCNYNEDRTVYQVCKTIVKEDHNQKFENRKQAYSFYNYVLERKDSVNINKDIQDKRKIIYVKLDSIDHE